MPLRLSLTIRRASQAGRRSARVWHPRLANQAIHRTFGFWDVRELRHLLRLPGPPRDAETLLFSAEDRGDAVPRAVHPHLQRAFKHSRGRDAQLCQASVALGFQPRAGWRVPIPQARMLARKVDCPKLAEDRTAELLPLIYYNKASRVNLWEQDVYMVL